MKNLYIIEEGKYPEKKKNTENCFYGHGWKVEKINDGYFLFYLAARQGGDEEKLKITKEMFDEIRGESYTLSEVFKKYNLYNKL